MVDQFLGGLFGNKEDDDEPARHRRARDFVDRHERGAHHEMSDEEVLQNYRAAASQLPPDEYRQAAAEAFRQMSPEQRRELRRYLKHHSGDRFDARDDSPEEIAQAMQKAKQETADSGGLGSLLGDIQGKLDNPIVKIAIAGIAAMAAKKLTEPRQ